MRALRAALSVLGNADMPTENKSVGMSPILQRGSAVGAAWCDSAGGRRQFPDKLALEVLVVLLEAVSATLLSEGLHRHHAASLLLGQATLPMLRLVDRALAFARHDAASRRQLVLWQAAIHLLMLTG